MATVTKSAATAAAEQIRDETVPAANTAVRVGGLLINLIDSLFGRQGESFALAGVLSPAQITADQNDYNPTGLADVSKLRLSCNAHGRFIGGISGGVVGRFLVLDNVGSFTLDLDHDSASSTAANRIFTPSGGRFAIQPNESVILFYDATSSRWRVVGVRGSTLGHLTLGPSGTGNFDNAGRFTASFMRFSPTGSAAQNLTGMDAAGDRVLACVANVGTQILLIKNDSSSSTAALRFLTPGGRDYPLAPGSSVWCIYDLTSARWRVIGPNNEPSHGTALTGAAGTPGQTITVDQGAVRTLYGNLAQNSTIDIDNTNAIDDETITIVSHNVAAFTYAIRDHSNNVVFTIPASTRMSVTLRKVTGVNFANPVGTRL
jgi:hypothetical protein